MPFVKGQSGNPGGRIETRYWRKALIKALGNEAIDKLAELCVKKALEGDYWSMKEIADRLDGKAVQQTILTGDEEGGPIRIGRVEIVPALMEQVGSGTLTIAIAGDGIGGTDDKGDR